MHRSGDVILTRMQFVDNNESKIRPALILFEDLGNIVIAGITTNLQMKGIPLSKKDGAAQESLIKLNYIFTITDEAVIKNLFQLNAEKRKLIFNELNKYLTKLID